MPLKTSEAFILDVRKLQEADRLVVLFTEDEGKLKGVAASAARSRRRFGGRLERLSRVRATYFEKEGRDLCRIDSCDLLDESFTLHQELPKAALLSYIAEIVDTFSREREADPKYFRLLKSLIGALRAGAGEALLARYFEVWTLRLHGLLPDLDRCGVCDRDLGRTGAYLAVGDTPGAVCGACHRRGVGRPAGGSCEVKLSPAALALMERIRVTSPGDLAAREISAAALAEIEKAATRMLLDFVGQPFRSYRFMKEVVRP